MDFDSLWRDLTVEVAEALRGYRSRLSEIEVQVKTDKTLLTEADLAIESLITDRVRSLDPDAVFVAEEDTRHSPRTDVLAAPGLLWVIDPIDGTAEFVNSASVEYCSVICALREGEPVAALIVAPELMADGSALVIQVNSSAGQVRVNGEPLSRVRAPRDQRWASVTRSKGTEPRGFEAALTQDGYALKTRTTSQTLDMVRTAIDVAAHTGRDLPRFDLFYRPRQKVWDGLAGLCLGEAMGLRAVDRHGRRRLPASIELLAQPEPTFDSTIMGEAGAVDRLLEQLR